MAAAKNWPVTDAMAKEDDATQVMAAGSMEKSTAEQQRKSQGSQIYASSKTEVCELWREKCKRDAKKYWDIFYKRHEDRFFKDRHYLDKEWGRYFTRSGVKVMLEAGCGAGNALFPLLATYSNIFVHACDFSPRAIKLVKMNKNYSEDRIKAFVCDLTIDDLNKAIPPSTVDIVTMVFVLSAVSPEKMPLVLKNIKKILKPNGYVLFRDYAIGDLAQERFIVKDQTISQNFYARGDGTCAFYFSKEFLAILFQDAGFHVEELGLCCRKVENRARELVMNRRWIQAVFKLSESPKSYEIDLSEGLAAAMFAISPSHCNELMELNFGGHYFKIKLLSKEHQHTCRSTGLMLWESARFMASILARNANIVAGKTVLELGSGCAGVCSMVAAASARLVVATDKDANALDLLDQNVASNLSPEGLARLVRKELEWGNMDHIEAIRQLNPEGFKMIIGTDVTYSQQAISSLFRTARELISSNQDAAGDAQPPSLVLCHVLRRVDEPSIVAAALQFGFLLVDKWPNQVPNPPLENRGGHIGSWLMDVHDSQFLPSTALSILYFHTQRKHVRAQNDDIVL